jgi:predicted RNA-binding Zn-ribbon protein involved in translation (DUF1610 family)
MNLERIKEIQEETAYPDSISVQQALLKVWNECEQEKVERLLSSLFTTSKKTSSDGVFFRCNNCGFEPQMASITDDLLTMHFCPKCGSKFE